MSDTSIETESRLATLKRRSNELSSELNLIATGRKIGTRARTPSFEDALERDALLTERRAVREEIKELEEAERREALSPLQLIAQAQGDLVQIKREPLTYEPGSGHSFFQDVARSKVQHDENSTARLRRHAIEMEHEYREYRRRDRVGFERDLRSAAFVTDARQLTASGRELPPFAFAESFGSNRAPSELRANPNTTLATGGEFVPPAWLISKFSGQARAARPLADAIGSEPMPKGVGRVLNVPRLTSAMTSGVQPTDGAAVAGTDPTTSTLSSNVATIAGQVDVSLQLLELSPLDASWDQVVMSDLTIDINSQLEKQLISGTGVNQQLLGLLNVVGINAVTFTSGSPTFALFYPFMGQAFAAVGNNRLLPPETWLMAPRRFAWMASALDTANSPVVPVDQSTADERPSPLAVPILLDGAIAAGTSADQVIACRPSDLLLWESPKRLRISMSPLAGTLQVRIQVYSYVAAILNRYPSGISVISGTGLAQPSGF